MELLWRIRHCVVTEEGEEGREDKRAKRARGPPSEGIVYKKEPKLPHSVCLSWARVE